MPRAGYRVPRGKDERRVKEEGRVPRAEARAAGRSGGYRPVDLVDEVEGTWGPGGRRQRTGGSGAGGGKGGIGGGRRIGVKEVDGGGGIEKWQEWLCGRFGAAQAARRRFHFARA